MTTKEAKALKAGDVVYVRPGYQHQDDGPLYKATVLLPSLDGRKIELKIERDDKGSRSCATQGTYLARVNINAIYLDSEEVRECFRIQRELVAEQQREGVIGYAQEEAISYDRQWDIKTLLADIFTRAGVTDKERELLRKVFVDPYGSPSTWASLLLGRSK